MPLTTTPGYMAFGIKLRAHVGDAQVQSSQDEYCAHHKHKDRHCSPDPIAPAECDHMAAEGHSKHSWYSAQAKKHHKCSAAQT